MKRDELVLGIDTSNYKTSLAIVSRNGIIVDERKMLKVKDGERGLRQSEALFQHINNIPELFERLGDTYKSSICAVSFSERPRAVDGSYMPCFLAGGSCARSIASFLGVPAYGFSHQEGHIEAVRWSADFEKEREFLACHFSGGTCEVLKVTCCHDSADRFYDAEIIGGTKDISFGQILDRAGVKMGIPFPCGEEMDKIAISSEETSDVLTDIKVRSGLINLSGMETQIMKTCSDVNRDHLIREVFDKICDAVMKMLEHSAEATGISDILMSGGVSSSRYIRNRILKESDMLNVVFDNGTLSSDNAVGTALLGGRKIWD